MLNRINACATLKITQSTVPIFFVDLYRENKKSNDWVMYSPEKQRQTVNSSVNFITKWYQMNKYQIQTEKKTIWSVATTVFFCYS